MKSFLSLLLLSVTVCLLCTPLLTPTDHWGIGDWDYFAFNYEAMRLSVLEYHQIPWWNPWCCGGIPLAANPQLGLLSLDFLLVMVLGTYPGLKLATVIHLLIGAWGGWWLARERFESLAARWIVGWLYVANGSVVMYVTVGHLGIHLVAWLPWAIGLLCRLERSPLTGAWLGSVVAAAALLSFQYFLVYLVLILGCGYGWRLVASDRPGRWNLIRGGLLSLAVYLSLAGMRTALAAEIVLDFPRPEFSIIRHRTPWLFLVRALVWPGQNIESWNLSPGWHEYGNYIGVTALLLAGFSLNQGWRWWHTLTLITLWAALGNSETWHLSYWISKVPVLSTLRVASRWRVMTDLGLAICCGAALNQLHRYADWRRQIVPVAISLIVVDGFWNLLPILKQTFRVPPIHNHCDAPQQPIVQLQNYPIPPLTNSVLLPCLDAGHGIIFAYEPLVGQYGSALSNCLWVTHPDYQSEYVCAEGEVKVVSWSPNRIILEAPADSSVRINQNPGSYWIGDRGRLFPELRCADRHSTFWVDSSDRGIVKLETWPSAWKPGLLLTVFGFVGTAATVFWIRVSGYSIRH